MKLPFTLTTNPNLWAEFVRLVMYMMIGFKVLDWTSEQQGLVLAVVSGALTLIVRSAVMPTQTIRDAGHTVEQIKADAKQWQAQARVTEAKDDLADAKAKADQEKNP